MLVLFGCSGKELGTTQQCGYRFRRQQSSRISVYLDTACYLLAHMLTAFNIP